MKKALLSGVVFLSLMGTSNAATTNEQYKVCASYWGYSSPACNSLFNRLLEENQYIILAIMYMHYLAISICAEYQQGYPYTIIPPNALANAKKWMAGLDQFAITKNLFADKQESDDFWAKVINEMKNVPSEMRSYLSQAKPDRVIWQCQDRYNALRNVYEASVGTVPKKDW